MDTENSKVVKDHLLEAIIGNGANKVLPMDDTEHIIYGGKPLCPTCIIKGLRNVCMSYDHIHIKACRQDICPHCLSVYDLLQDTYVSSPYIDI